MPRKSSAASTRSPTPISPRSSSPNSEPTCKTAPAPGGALPEMHHRPLEGPDRRLASCAGDRRAHRGDNLIKRIRRIGFGFRSFHHYRIRVLLCARRPSWHLLPTLTPR
jgi:hypothetical protein